MTSVRERIGYVELGGAERGPAGDERPNTAQSTAMRVRLETGLTLSGYVRWLLEDAGGRLRQREVVERTGWSEYTVSRVLTRMEADGTVERTRVGHEKLVLLPSEPDERQPVGAGADDT